MIFLMQFIASMLHQTASRIKLFVNLGLLTLDYISLNEFGTGKIDEGVLTEFFTIHTEILIHLFKTFIRT